MSIVFDLFMMSYHDGINKFLKTKKKERICSYLKKESTTLY